MVASRLREIPTLYAMVPGVLRGRFENPLDVTPAIAETIASDISGQARLYAKPRRVATTRWSTWHDQVEESLIPYFHSQAMVAGMHGDTSLLRVHRVGVAGQCSAQLCAIIRTSNMGALAYDRFVAGSTTGMPECL